MRLIRALIALLLLPLLYAVPADAAAPDGSTLKAQRARVTLTASPEWVRKGGIVTLRGRVAGVRGRATVTIYQKNKGSRKWVVEAVKRTTRKGRFTHREDVNSGDRTYKACVKRACGSVLVHMGKQPAQATALSITAISSSSVEAGQAFTVSGAASANLNGRAVEVQAFDGGSSTWGAVGRATVQNGAWSAPTAVSTAGRAIPLRAAFLGGVGLTPSSTTSSSVTVYGWYYLTDMEPVSGSYEDGPRELNGITYTKPIAFSEYWNSPPEFNLSRSCLRLVAMIGVSDYASTSTEYAVNVSTDSVLRYSKTGMRLGQSFPLEVSLTNSLRLRIEHISTAGDDEDYLVFGDARVLCAF